MPSSSSSAPAGGAKARKKSPRAKKREGAPVNDDDGAASESPAPSVPKEKKKANKGGSSKKSPAATTAADSDKKKKKKKKGTGSKKEKTSAPTVPPQSVSDCVQWLESKPKRRVKGTGRSGATKAAAAFSSEAFCVLHVKRVEAGLFPAGENPQFRAYIAQRPADERTVLPLVSVLGTEKRGNRGPFWDSVSLERGSIEPSDIAMGSAPVAGSEVDRESIAPALTSALLSGQRLDSLPIPVAAARKKVLKSLVLCVDFFAAKGKAGKAKSKVKPLGYCRVPLSVVLDSAVFAPPSVATSVVGAVVHSGSSSAAERSTASASASPAGDSMEVRIFGSEEDAIAALRGEGFWVSPKVKDDGKKLTENEGSALRSDSESSDEELVAAVLDVSGTDGFGFGAETGSDTVTAATIPASQLTMNLYMEVDGWKPLFDSLSADPAGIIFACRSLVDLVRNNTGARSASKLIEYFRPDVLRRLAVLIVAPERGCAGASSASEAREIRAAVVDVFRALFLSPQPSLLLSLGTSGFLEIIACILPFVDKVTERDLVDFLKPFCMFAASQRAMQELGLISALLDRLAKGQNSAGSAVDVDGKKHSDTSDYLPLALRVMEVLMRLDTPGAETTLVEAGIISVLIKMLRGDGTLRSKALALLSAFAADPSKVVAEYLRKEDLYGNLLDVLTNVVSVERGKHGERENRSRRVSKKSVSGKEEMSDGDAAVPAITVLEASSSEDDGDYIDDIERAILVRSALVTTSQRNHAFFDLEEFDNLNFHGNARPLMDGDDRNASGTGLLLLPPKQPNSYGVWVVPRPVPVNSGFTCELDVCVKFGTPQNPAQDDDPDDYWGGHMFYDDDSDAVVGGFSVVLKSCGFDSVGNSDGSFLGAAGVQGCIAIVFRPGTAPASVAGPVSNKIEIYHTGGVDQWGSLPYLDCSEWGGHLLKKLEIPVGAPPFDEKPHRILIRYDSPKLQVFFDSAAGKPVVEAEIGDLEKLYASQSTSVTSESVRRGFEEAGMDDGDTTRMWIQFGASCGAHSKFWQSYEILSTRLFVAADLADTNTKVDGGSLEDSAHLRHIVMASTVDGEAKNQVQLELTLLSALDSLLERDSKSPDSISLISDTRPSVLIPLLLEMVRVSWFPPLQLRIARVFEFLLRSTLARPLLFDPQIRVVKSLLRRVLSPVDDLSVQLRFFSLLTDNFLEDVESRKLVTRALPALLELPQAAPARSEMSSDEKESAKDNLNQAKRLYDGRRDLSRAVLAFVSRAMNSDSSRRAKLFEGEFLEAGIFDAIAALCFCDVYDSKPAMSPPKKSKQTSFSLWHVNSSSDDSDDAATNVQFVGTDPWNCAVCTFENQSHSAQCAVCNSDRPVQTVAVDDMGNINVLPDPGTGDDKEEPSAWDGCDRAPTPPLVRIPVELWSSDSEPDQPLPSARAASSSSDGESSGDFPVDPLFGALAEDQLQDEAIEHPETPNAGLNNEVIDGAKNLEQIIDLENDDDDDGVDDGPVTTPDRCVWERNIAGEWTPFDSMANRLLEGMFTRDVKTTVLNHGEYRGGFRVSFCELQCVENTSGLAWAVRRVPEPVPAGNYGSAAIEQTPSDANGEGDQVKAVSEASDANGEDDQEGAASEASDEALADRPTDSGAEPSARSIKDNDDSGADDAIGDLSGTSSTSPGTADSTNSVSEDLDGRSENQWEWCDDNGEWQGFDSMATRLLEGMLTRGLKSATLNHGEYARSPGGYLVNFETLSRRENSTGKEAPIRRNPVPEASSTRYGASLKAVAPQQLDSEASAGISWSCSVCTYVHANAEQAALTSCEVCGSPRSVTIDGVSSGSELEVPVQVDTVYGSVTLGAGSDLDSTSSSDSSSNVGTVPQRPRSRSGSGTEGGSDSDDTSSSMESITRLLARMSGDMDSSSESDSHEGVTNAGYTDESTGQKHQHASWVHPDVFLLRELLTTLTSVSTAALPSFMRCSCQKVVSDDTDSRSVDSSAGVSMLKDESTRVSVPEDANNSEPQCYNVCHALVRLLHAKLWPALGQEYGSGEFGEELHKLTLRAVYHLRRDHDIELIDAGLFRALCHALGPETQKMYLLVFQAFFDSVSPDRLWDAKLTLVGGQSDQGLGHAEPLGLLLSNSDEHVRSNVRKFLLRNFGFDYSPKKRRRSDAARTRESGLRTLLVRRLAASAKLHDSHISAAAGSSPSKPRHFPLPDVNSEEEDFFGDSAVDTTTRKSAVVDSDGRCSQCETYHGHMTWCEKGTNPGIGAPPLSAKKRRRRPRAGKFPPVNGNNGASPESVRSGAENVYAVAARRVIWQLEHGCIDHLPYRIVFCDGDRSTDGGVETWKSSRASINFLLEFSGDARELPLLTHAIYRATGSALPRAAGLFVSPESAPNIAATTVFDNFSAEKWHEIAPVVPSDVMDAKQCAKFDNFDFLSSAAYDAFRELVSSGVDSPSLPEHPPIPVAYFDVKQPEIPTPTQEKPSAEASGDTKVSEAAQSGTPVASSRRASIEISRPRSLSDSSSLSANSDILVPASFSTAAPVVSGALTTGVPCQNCGADLAFVGTSQDNGWMCDSVKDPRGCVRGCTTLYESYGWGRYTCNNSSCDYDLCDRCYLRDLGTVGSNLDRITTFYQVPLPHASRAHYIHLKFLVPVGTTAEIKSDSFTFLGVALPKDEWRTLRQRQKKAIRSTDGKSPVPPPGYFFEFEHGHHDRGGGASTDAVVGRSRMLPRKIESPGIALGVIPFEQEFKFVKDDDENGVLHWLGMGGLSRWPDGKWRNPYASNQVRVSLSGPLHSDSMSPDLVVARLSDRPRECFWTYTPSHGAPWIILDLMRFKLSCSRLTLRHGYSRKNSFLTKNGDWYFEGSSDGENWNTIAVPEKYSGFSLGGFETKSFAVTGTAFYPYFRIRTAAHKQMCLNGIELYGELRSHDFSE